MATTTTLNGRILTIVNQYLAKVKKAGIPVEQAIVFGSQSKGTAKAWSDIDLCIVSPNFGYNRYDERLKLLRLTDSATIDIEPHPYSSQDLAFPLDPLASEIRKFGINISLD
jgi:uncharacterized protein